MWDGTPVDFHSTVGYRCINDSLFFEQNKDIVQWNMTCLPGGSWDIPDHWPRCLSCKQTIQLLDWDNVRKNLNLFQQLTVRNLLKGLNQELGNGITLMNTRLKLSTPVVLLECLNHLVESSMLPQLQCVLGIKPGHLHYWILVKVNIHFYSKPGLCESRSGHVPTFLKLFRSILERGPSDKSFRSHSFFVVSFRSIPSRSVPF